MTTYQENAIAANPNNEEPAKESRVIEVDFGTSEIDPTSDSVILPPAGEEPRAWPKTFLSNEEAVQLLASKNSGLRPNMSRYAYRFVKRAFDIVLSLVTLIVCLLPGLVLCAAILIKSPGVSPLYSQQRIGRLRKDGSFRTFKMWKLRSMVPNADQLLEKYQDLNEADGPLFKIKEDPRVIPGIGSFIRRHSIDEFSQLINVLKGDIPQRIIKTGQGELCEISSLFALPAKEMRTRNVLLPQVKVASGACQWTVRNFFSNLTAQRAQTQRVFAKRYLAPISGFYGSACDISRECACVSSQATRAGWNA